MALKGSEMIFHPAAIWKNQGFRIENLYEQSFMSRSLDNRVFLATVNQVGEDLDLNDCFVGHSMIVSPLGDILAIAGADETMITANIDFDEWAERKRGVTWNPFRQRVPSHYSIISQEYDALSA
jgi:predicted amidohydrolase